MAVEELEHLLDLYRGFVARDDDYQQCIYHSGGYDTVSDCDHIARDVARLREQLIEADPTLRTLLFHEEAVESNA